MATRDSYLVKQIKKLERLGDKANYNLSEYFFNKSPEGQAAMAIDHIHEVVHEALIRYDEAKLEEKYEREREALEKKKEKEKIKPKPVFQGLEKHITTNVPWWKKSMKKFF